MAYGGADLSAQTPGARLTLDHLGYDYRAADGGPGNPALVDVCLDIAAGRTVAVVGPTGAGKSTLAALMVRLIDPQTGRVLIDGLDAVSYTHLRAHETVLDLVCSLLLEHKNKTKYTPHCTHRAQTITTL